MAGGETAGAGQCHENKSVQTKRYEGSRIQFLQKKWQMETETPSEVGAEVQTETAWIQQKELVGVNG